MAMNQDDASLFPSQVTDVNPVGSTESAWQPTAVSCSVEKSEQHQEFEQSTATSSYMLKALQQLLLTGGWTAAVLVAFRIATLPLVVSGNGIAIVILASAISLFLVLRAVTQMIREIRLLQSVRK
jgi:hypothetical protein